MQTQHRCFHLNEASSSNAKTDILFVFESANVPILVVCHSDVVLVSTNLV